MSIVVVSQKIRVDPIRQRFILDIVLFQLVNGHIQCGKGIGINSVSTFQVVFGIDAANEHRIGIYAFCR